MEKTKLSTVVKTLRKEYGLTQEDLALKSGVGLCFVRNMEQGKPTLRIRRSWHYPFPEKKTKVQVGDFLSATKTMVLEENVMLRLITSIQKTLPKWKTLIQDSFLSEGMKCAYTELVTSWLARLQR